MHCISLDRHHCFGTCQDIYIRHLKKKSRLMWNGSTKLIAKPDDGGSRASCFCFCMLVVMYQHRLSDPIDYP